MTIVDEIEAALVAQWSLLGCWPKGSLHDEGGLTWFETPIRHSPYNGVVRTHLDPDGADAAIARLLERFRARGVNCVWFVGPSASPADLGARLEAQGLARVEPMTYMSLELDGWQPSAPAAGGVTFEEVLDDDALATYANLAIAYWEIPGDDRALVAELHRALGPGRVPGRRYLALDGGRAVGKGYLSLVGPPGVASIYGMSVLPEARGRGIARGMTTVLVERARQEGCHRVVLHASEMAVALYRRAGFVARAVWPVYATARIWSGAH